MLDQSKKAVISKLYEELKDGDTVLGFDEARGVGVVSLVDDRTEEPRFLPVAEITVPVIPKPIDE